MTTEPAPTLSAKYTHADGHECWWQHPREDSVTVGFIVLGTGVGSLAKKCPHPHDWDASGRRPAWEETVEEMWDD